MRYLSQEHTAVSIESSLRLRGKGKGKNEDTELSLALLAVMMDLLQQSLHTARHFPHGEKDGEKVSVSNA